MICGTDICNAYGKDMQAFLTLDSTIQTISFIESNEKQAIWTSRAGLVWMHQYLATQLAYWADVELWGWITQEIDEVSDLEELVKCYKKINYLKAQVIIMSKGQQSTALNEVSKRNLEALREVSDTLNGSVDIEKTKGRVEEIEKSYNYSVEYSRFNKLMKEAEFWENRVKVLKSRNEAALKLYSDPSPCAAANQ